MGGKDFNSGVTTNLGEGIMKCILSRKNGGTNKIILMMMTLLILSGMTGMARAELVQIGTATLYPDPPITEYNGYKKPPRTYYNKKDTSAPVPGYQLLFDTDTGLTWLDYTSDQGDWWAQMDWAALLETTLTFHLFPDVQMNWTDNVWRLPDTGIIYKKQTYGWDGSGTYTYGYNITDTEYGHLYYEELGNVGYLDLDRTILPSSEWGVHKAAPFLNLRFDDYPGPIQHTYWSGAYYWSLAYQTGWTLSP